MSRHASELSLAELSQIGADAVREALDVAFAKGVPVTGLIADDKGELKLARRYADGSIEWIERSAGDEIASKFKVAG